MNDLRKELARIRKALGPYTRSYPDPRGANLAQLAQELQRLCVIVDKLAEKIEGGRL